MFGFDSRSERGAAAIEFALVLPVLILLLFGTVEVFRLESAQASVSDAARAAARSFSIGNNDVTASAAGIAASNIDLQPADFAFAGDTDGTCPHGGVADVTVTYQLKSSTGLFSMMNLTGKAMFACQA